MKSGAVRVMDVVGTPANDDRLDAVYPGVNNALENDVALSVALLASRVRCVLSCNASNGFFSMPVGCALGVVYHEPNTTHTWSYGPLLNPGTIMSRFYARVWPTR